MSFGDSAFKVIGYRQLAPPAKELGRFYMRLYPV